MSSALHSCVVACRLLWRHDKLHFFLLAYFVLLYSWIYRVAIRCLFDGASFRWVNIVNTRMLGEERRALLAGNGIDGHFLIILLLALMAASLLYLLINRPDGFTRTVVLAWATILFVHQLTLSMGLGTDYVIRGDTMGMVLPYYILGPLLHGLMVALIVFRFWIRDRNILVFLPFLPIDQHRRKFVAGILALYLPLFLLFRLGSPDDTSDQIGIILLYLQLSMLVLALVNVREHEAGK